MRNSILLGVWVVAHPRRKRLWRIWVIDFGLELIFVGFDCSLAASLEYRHRRRGCSNSSSHEHRIPLRSPLHVTFKFNCFVVHLFEDRGGGRGSTTFGGCSRGG